MTIICINILSPVLLTFAIIIAGHYLGKIKICDICLDISGVLIVAIVSGILISYLSRNNIGDFTEIGNNSSFSLSLSFLSSLGTALFVSTIGLSSGYIITEKAKLNSLKSMFIGAAMVIFSFFVVSLISLLDKAADKSVLLGILCGSMTSTPGLSAVSDLDGVNEYLSTAGYGCSYIFGVIGVVLFVQICARNDFKKRSSNLKLNQKKESSSELYGLVQVAIAIITGTVLGSAEIPFLDFSLGTSGGILCTGIVLGLIISKVDKEHAISVENISILRNMGLAFFFVGSGIPAGMNLSEVIQFKYIVYGLIITIFTLLFGYTISRLLNRKDPISVLSNICGGMTSTPAIGVLCRRCDCEHGLSDYSMSYVSSLFVMVIGVRIIG